MKGSRPAGKRKVEQRPGLGQQCRDAGRARGGTSGRGRVGVQPARSSPSTARSRVRSASLTGVRGNGAVTAAGALLPSMCAPDGPAAKASQCGVLFIITIITILITSEHLVVVFFHLPFGWRQSIRVTRQSVFLFPI